MRRGHVAIQTQKCHNFGMTRPTAMLRSFCNITLHVHMLMYDNVRLLLEDVMWCTSSARTGRCNCHVYMVNGFWPAIGSPLIPPSSCFDASWMLSASGAGFGSVKMAWTSASNLAALINAYPGDATKTAARRMRLWNDIGTSNETCSLANPWVKHGQSNSGRGRNCPAKECCESTSKCK